MKVNKEKQALVPCTLLRELLQYEYETGLFYWLVSRCNNKIKSGQLAGDVDKHGYARIKINGYSFKAHRLAWVYIHGDFPEGEQPFIDHINGKRDDNRIVNLRVSSSSENQRNKQSTSKNTSGITGVCRVKVPRPSGKIDWYWVATWRDKNGKKGEKRFNIETHGEEVAKQLAITYRAEQLRLLEINHGITYSERHGK